MKIKYSGEEENKDPPPIEIIPLELDFDECPICLERMNVKNYKALKCSHRYHETCITQWLENNSSCPLCRDTVIVEKITGELEKLIPKYNNRPIDQLLCNMFTKVNDIMNDAIKKVYPRRRNMLNFGYVLLKLVEVLCSEPNLSQENKNELHRFKKELIGVQLRSWEKAKMHDKIWEEVEKML